MSDRNNQLLLVSLMNQKKDTKDLKSIFNNNFLNNKFPWIKEWNNRLTETNNEAKYHKFSFMIYNRDNQESVAYFEMKEIFNHLVKDPNSVEKKQQFIEFCQRFAVDQDKKYLLRMFLVLLVYYDLFNENKKCAKLVELLQQVFEFLEIEEKEKDLICCFIDPHNFMCLPNATDSLATLFSHSVEKEYVPARHVILFVFFFFHILNVISKLKALVNMLAAVMRLPKKRFK